MKNLIWLALFTILSAACSHPGSTSSSPADPNLGGNGTFTGSGGGNGIDGKVIEEYQKNIASLPEYKTYIAPLLRRMSQGHPDVLFVYLTWAVKAKRWYFVPVELPLLPKDKTKLAFSSDQLALHSDHEIFIYATGYNERPLEDRAALLLHEMVMGARLLMKAQAQAQCEALSLSESIELCKDPAYLKIAANPPDGPITLDGDDHEAVRTMTATLLENGQDVSAQALYALRRRLGFNFPWDSTMSRMGLSDFLDAFERSRLANDRFVAQASSVNNSPSLCVLEVDNRNSSMVSITQGVSPISETANAGQPSFYAIESGPSFSNSFPVANANFIGFQVLMKLENNMAAGLDANGVIDPFGSGAIVDELTVKPISASRTGDPGVITKFYVSRGPSPRIYAYTMTSVRAIVKDTVPGASVLDSNVEWVVVESQTPLVCKIATK